MVNVASLFNDLAFFVFVMTFIFIIIAVYFDYNKRRKIVKNRFVSFILPVFNSTEHIGETIESIFKAYDKKKFELIVINDCSRDNTLEVIKQIRKKYSFKIINNAVNMGKARSINRAFKLARGEIIFMIDSDVIISKKAVMDVLARLEDKKIGGVSCRYIPINKGFLSTMQRVEYGMISLIQRSYNYFSTVGFWGGCMAVKREVFLKVGLLSENSLTEDSDLALKIGESGWLAQESSVPVHSYAPNSLPKWYKQKLRWLSGGAQNFFKHFKFFATHPAVILFFFSYLLLATSFLISLINNIIILKSFYSIYSAFRDAGYSILTAAVFAKISSGIQLIKVLALYLLYPLFSIPYVYVNYPVLKRPATLLLIFPYTIIYIPLFTIMSIIGFAWGAYKYIALRNKERAW